MIHYSSVKCRNKNDLNFETYSKTETYYPRFPFGLCIRIIASLSASSHTQSQTNKENTDNEVDKRNQRFNKIVNKKQKTPSYRIDLTVGSVVSEDACEPTYSKVKFSFEVVDYLFQYSIISLLSALQVSTLVYKWK